MSDILNANYHSSDFDYDIWASEARASYTLPSFSSDIQTSQSADDDTADKKHWDFFFKNHNSGTFFKPRKYLFMEFQKWLTLPNSNSEYPEDSLRIVEVGCGHGCSMYPLMNGLSYVEKYIATDYSLNALTILKENPSYDHSRIVTAFWDVTVPPDLNGLFQKPSDAVLCIFALSAVKPELHVTALKNMAAILKPNGVILFRDYGMHDMTMYRHTLRHAENLYQRSDSTLAYYFDMAYMREIAALSGLTVIELEYATVEVRNRKMENRMKRVFLHAVLQRERED